MITFREVKEQIEEVKEDVQDSGSAKAKAAELFARCRVASTAAHYAHLITSSYAQHKALNEFYEEVVDAADTFAEGFMGRYGKFESFPNIREASTDGLTIVGNLTKWIDANRAVISELSEIQNDIDSILTVCNSTAYKLRELK